MLAGLAIAALSACGGVSVSDQDGSSGSGADASQGGSSDGSPGAPDAQPDAQTPGMCEAGVTQLLKNPSFEDAMLPNGAIDWIEDPPPLTYPNDQSPVHTPDGRRTALLGSAAKVMVRLTQPVSIPASAQSLQLSFIKCILTEENGTEVFDQLHALLLDEGGAVLEEFGTFSNLDAVTGCGSMMWPGGRVVFTAADAHAGENAQLQFVGDFDDGTQTTFWFDALRLDARGDCPADAAP